jgi:Leucine-rich repeat (LRR) protein
MNWVSDLCLDNNSIITLPPEIKTMRSLTKLSLRGNYLETLPKELRRCGDLECLLLERNKLTNLPSYVYTMLPLRVLALANNMLDSGCIPDDLPLNAGSRLQALVLDSNNIGKLSGAVGLFSSLNVLSFSFNTVNFLHHIQTLYPIYSMPSTSCPSDLIPKVSHVLSCLEVPVPCAAFSLTPPMEINRLRACQMRSRRTNSLPTCS